MSDMSQVYRYHFPVFCRYRFVALDGGDGDLLDFRVLLQPTRPLQQPIDVTAHLPEEFFNMLFERELTLQLEAHAEAQRMLAGAPQF